MRLIDADGLMEHAMRDKLDPRELIFQMITEQDSDWWYNRKTGIIDGLQIAFETFTNLRS